MVTRYEIAQNALVESQSDESPILVYVNPDGAERETLLNRFDIDDHTLSSALDPDEVSRIEISPDFISLIWKRPTNYSGKDNFYFNVASVGLFLIKDKLIVVLPDDIPLIEPGGRHAPQVHTVFDVFLAFLYYTTRHYLEHLKVIKMVSRELQQRINTSMENKNLIQMFNLSESLIYYLNAINANGVSLVKLNNYVQKAGYHTEAIELLDDIIIENNQCYKQAEIYSTVYSGLMDARGSLVNNNVNVLLRKLTMINVVFLPLNLIAGIGGMSEFSMMTSGIDWRISYSIFLVVLVLIGVLTGVILGKLNFGREQTSRPRRRR